MVAIQEAKGLIIDEWSILGGRSKENKTIIRLYHIFENLRKNANRSLTVLTGHFEKN